MYICASTCVLMQYIQAYIAPDNGTPMNIRLQFCVLKCYNHIVKLLCIYMLEGLPGHVVAIVGVI